MTDIVTTRIHMANVPGSNSTENPRLYNPEIVDTIIDPSTSQIIPAVTLPNLIVLEELTGQYTGVSNRAWNSLGKAAGYNEHVREAAIVDPEDELASTPKVLGYYAATFSLLVEYLGTDGVREINGFGAVSLSLMMRARRNLYLPSH